MAAVAAETHIAVPSTARELPASPLATPLIGNNGHPASHLSPSTALEIPLAPPTALASLADAMDASRTSLNALLTAWKDWFGKEDAATAHDDEPEIEEEE